MLYHFIFNSIQIFINQSIIPALGAVDISLSPCTHRALSAVSRDLSTAPSKNFCNSRPRANYTNSGYRAFSSDTILI